MTKLKKEKEKKEQNRKEKVQLRFELPTCWLQGMHHNHNTTKPRH